MHGVSQQERGENGWCCVVLEPKELKASCHDHSYIWNDQEMSV